METFFVFKVSNDYICTLLRRKMKEKIIETAAEMFLNLGFKSVTMDDIAHKMGISKKTIYTHFNNKTKLIEETTFSLFQQISCGIDAICSTNLNPIEEIFKIRTFVMNHLKNEKSSPQFQLQKYYPKISATLLRRQFDVMKTCVENNLTKGVEQGLFRKEINIGFISRIYFKGMTGIKDADTFPEETYNMHFLMDSYIDYHIRAIATEKGLQTLTQLQQTNE